MTDKQYVDSYAFDVELEDKEIRLDIYQSGIKTEVKAQGKKESYRFFKLLTSVKPENLEETIQMLRNKQVLAITDLNNESFDDLVINEPLLFLKTRLLKRKNKVLQKVYCENVVNNMCYIHTYIIGINTYTGELKAIPMQNMGLWNEKKVQDLQEMGYFHVTETCLMDYLHSLEHKTIKLERTNKNS